MSIPIKYTHSYNLCIILVNGISISFLSFGGGLGLTTILFEQSLGDKVYIVQWIGIIGFGILHYIFITPVYKILSVWCYIKYQLKTPVTYKEAKFIAPAFWIDRNERWRTMEEIKQLPVKERKFELMKEANKNTFGNNKTTRDLNAILDKVKDSYKESKKQ